MSNKEKLLLLEEIMDIDEGTLAEDTVLSEIEEWDSIAILSFIAMMDEEFGKTVKGVEIKSFVTAKDAMDIMEA